MIEWHNEKRKIKELVPYVSNPRQITEKQAEDLKKSLDKFGLAASLVINTDNTIIGGHQRKKIMETLMQLPPDFEIDVRVPERELSIDEVRELNVRLNKNVAEWDFDILANEFDLDELRDWGFEKSDLDLDLWMPDPPDDAEPQIDKAEELRVKWGVETGQLWQLGEHRLVCGDCTDKAVVEWVMGEDKAEMVWTDPPYGMSLNTDYSGITGSKKSMAGGIKGNKYSEVIGDDVDFDPTNILELFNSTQEIFLFGADYYAKHLPSGGWFVWDKCVTKDGQVSDGAEKMIGSTFELCWSKQKHKRMIVRIFHRGFTSVDKSDRYHPTQKPIQLAEYFIEKFSETRSAIVDPYLGSGTTLIACERLGRKCRAVEISPAYVAVAIQRWVDVTGETPVLMD